MHFGAVISGFHHKDTKVTKTEVLNRVTEETEMARKRWYPVRKLLPLFALFPPVKMISLRALGVFVARSFLLSGIQQPATGPGNPLRYHGSW